MGLSRPNSAIGAFYDRWTGLFVDGFGSVLQVGMLATGTREDPDHTVLELAGRAGIHDGDRVVDAGCGVAGPATIIASRYPGVIIDGITISPRQVEMARALVADAGLSDRVRVHLGDYQRLPFPSGEYHQVLFFESTGYATDLSATYREAHRVLRAGGRLYIKDVFRKTGPLTVEEAAQMDDFDVLWGCTRTKTMGETIASIEEACFHIDLAREMPEIGTTRFAGSMFSLGDGGLQTTELGAVFAPRGLNPPIVFGEIRAVKSNPASGGGGE